MKVSNLKSIIKLFIGVFTVSIFAVACNNDNSDSGKTSTGTMKDTATAMNMDTGMSTTSTAKVGRRTGRASVMMPTTTSDNSKMMVDKMGYYNRAEVAPMFAGGQSSVDNYFNNNIEYPQDAIDNNIEGTVNVMFTIDEKGMVGNAKTMGTKLGYGLEEAAIKAVDNMPKWTPGTIKGKSVKAWYTLPVTFKIEG